MKVIEIKLKGCEAVPLACDCGYATWHKTGFHQYCPDCDEIVQFVIVSGEDNESPQ